MSIVVDSFLSYFTSQPFDTDNSFYTSASPPRASDREAIEAPSFPPLIRCTPVIYLWYVNQQK